MDICKLMRHNDDSNRVVSATLRFIDDSIPGALHNCPYTVSFANENIETDSTESFAS